MNHTFFIGSASYQFGVDISGLSGNDPDYAMKVNDSGVVNSLSRSESTGRTKLDLGGQDKSYLLSEYHTSPIYVAQLSTVSFHVANKPYCGTQTVRCITLAYALTVLKPSTDYTIYVENGYYYENPVNIPTGQNVTIIGTSIKYTLMTSNFPLNCFFFFLFTLFELFHYFIIFI
jgi:hypothetical protein